MGTAPFKRKLGMTVLALALSGTALIAEAGNIFLTGHDDDFHQSTAANAQMAAALAFVRNGSALPVLTFDAGTELTSQLTTLGVAFTNVNPTAANLAGAAGAALFSNTLYSAFVVASVTTCGGCDNPVGTGSIIATQSAAIASFFNAGGGILGLAGATDAAAYAYVPTSATNAGGSPPSSGYFQTPDGLALGIPAVNGDPTHNFFNEPGTGGLSASYVVVERLAVAGTAGTPESIALRGGTITDGGITSGIPEPETYAMLLAGLGLLGFVARRRKQKEVAAA